MKVRHISKGYFTYSRVLYVKKEGGVAKSHSQPQHKKLKKFQETKKTSRKQKNKQ